MKDQYVADIGDYGKYSLLKEFADAGVKVGVNWYYTDFEEGTNDGGITDYIEKGANYEHYCPKVFAAMRVLVNGNNRKIQAVEDSKLIKNAIYYNQMIDAKELPDERAQGRQRWFETSCKELQAAELVFLDPDNGILKEDRPRRKGAEKYVMPKEVEAYYKSGKNVVYYCHRGRRKEQAWEQYKALMNESLPDARPIVLTHHQGTQRSYVFLIHPDDYQLYRVIVDHFLEKWKEPARKNAGPPFTEEALNNWRY